MQHKHHRERVELERRPLQRDAQRQLGVDPALADEVGHHADEGEAGRDRRALEVVRLARGVLGQLRDRHVEAREPGEAAEDEDGEEDVVGRRAKAEGEGGGGGGHAE